MMPIEELGDNGGGYFNANTAHPYENPNPFTSILLSWLVVMIPFAFAVTFGKGVGSMRQGGVILASMVILFVIGLVLIPVFEGPGNPKLANWPGSARRPPPPTSAATWRARRPASG